MAQKNTKKKAKKPIKSKASASTGAASKAPRRNALGRGLSALMAANVQPAEEEVSVNDWREPTENKTTETPVAAPVAVVPSSDTAGIGVKNPPDHDPASEQLAELRARLDKGLAKEVARDFKNLRLQTEDQQSVGASAPEENMEGQKSELRIVPEQAREVEARADESRQSVEGFNYLPVDALKACAGQPRKHFEPSELEALAASIKESGLIQPLLVRPLSAGSGENIEYEIVAGERRFRAAQKAGLHKLPVHIRELSEREAFELSIVENVQREDLDPVEEARAYQRLADEFGETQADIAKAVGKERATVANMMRLLQLPPEVLTLLQSGKISTGHARAILMAPERLRLKFAQRVVSEKLSVRATEALASGKMPAVKSKSGKKGSEEIVRSPAIIDLENRIRGKLGTKVRLDVSGVGDEQKGELRISFFSRGELESLIEKLRV